MPGVTIRFGTAFATPPTLSPTAVQLIAPAIAIAAILFVRFTLHLLVQFTIRHLYVAPMNGLGEGALGLCPGGLIPQNEMPSARTNAALLSRPSPAGASARAARGRVTVGLMAASGWVKCYGLVSNGSLPSAHHSISPPSYMATRGWPSRTRTLARLAAAAPAPQ